MGSRNLNASEMAIDDEVPSEHDKKNRRKKRLTNIPIIVAACSIQLFLIATVGLPRLIARKRDVGRFGKQRKIDNHYHKTAIKEAPPTVPCTVRRPLTPPPHTHGTSPTLSELTSGIICGNGPPYLRRNALRDAAYYQPKSLFFILLPAEVRIQIYDLVYKEYYLHFFNTARKRLAIYTCSADPLKPGWACGTLHGNGGIGLGYADAYYTSSPVYTSAEEKNMTSLIKTCRRMYSETVDILYSRSTIIFTQPWTPLDLYRSILPQRFNSIAKLRIHKGYVNNFIPLDDVYHYPCVATSWTDTCRIISNMKGLRELIVMLEVSWCLVPVKYEGRPSILDDLKVVKQAKIFIVYTDCLPDELSSAFGEDVPYQIIVKSVRR